MTPEAPDFSLDAYDYHLPPERIAQHPAMPRDHSRLLVVEQEAAKDHWFYELPQILQPPDLLILNDTRVIPARLIGQKMGESTRTVEVFLLEELSDRQWLALVKPGRKLRPGAVIQFGTLQATVQAVDPSTRGRVIEFDLPAGDRLWPYLDQLGEVPLPPYIQTPLQDTEQYQTVYAQRPGAVAAPTAGLHFTPDLLSKLQHCGIDHCFITLHVGIGTFRPVEAKDIRQHHLHEEWLEVSAATVAKIKAAKQAGGRIIAVGTTVIRSLETAAQSGELQPFCGKSDLYIYPGYQPKAVEGFITNFHLPRSSLMMLVSAFIGRDRLLHLYNYAIDHSYRFYSFGDAMLILPSACHG